MRPRPFLLLIAGIALMLMAAGDADAEKEPLWNYATYDSVVSVAISADGAYIAAGSNGVYLFDKDSGTPLWNYTTDNYVVSVAISADGEYIAAGSYDENVYLFDKDNSTPLWNYTAEDRVLSVAISADGEYIVAGGEDDKVYLFGKDSSTPLWNYTTDNRVYAVAISADGEYIAAGGYDGKVYLFDKDSSTPLWNYTAGSSVWSVAISADGKYIAAGSWDKKVYLFDKDSSTPLWSYTTGYFVYSVAISADGEYITADSGAPYDDNVYLFDKDSSTPLWSYTTGYYVYTVAISADGEYIVSLAAGNVSLFNSNASPIATIDSITPSPAKLDEEATFNGTGSDGDGTVAAYLWESSIDGELSTEGDFSISNLSLGHHTIAFRVQDNDGGWCETSESLTVYAVPVAIAGEDLTTEVNKLIQFSGTGTDEDGSIIKYEWDFDGDGSYDLSSGDNGRTTNVYNNEGTYTAVLRVTDNDGFTATDSRVITVSKAGDGGGGDDGGGFLPAPSLAAAVAAVAVIALRRRR